MSAAAHRPPGTGKARRPPVQASEPGPVDADAALAGFAAPTRAWFSAAFAAPTPAQVGAWSAVAAGTDVLVVAPTGSGKTLAAFLWSLDRLAFGPPAETPGVRVLYVSPLKALAVDVERNLRGPLAGIAAAATAAGLPPPQVSVGMRTGDTSPAQRRALASHPPDILITTPESLYLLLTSAARQMLAGVRTVIIDEVHAVAGSKRGAHLALSLERLGALTDTRPRRVGLSATVRPVDEVAGFLSGGAPVAVVHPPSTRSVSLSVVVPVADMTALGEPVGPLGGPDEAAALQGPAAAGVPRASIWPHVEEAIVDLVQAHTSTIVFANSRRLAERLCARLNEIAAERAGLPGADPSRPAEVAGASGSAGGAPPVLARAHHGSVSREQRAAIEEDLKAGRLRAVVATSSLELGIDMGAVDLVVQVESPPSVASGLQRVGRAGHQVGATSVGVVMPKYRGDLLAATVTATRMADGAIEALRYPRNPLDVLAQQVVAMVAMDDWALDDLAALVRRAAPFAALPDSALVAVVDMLAGRYPSDAFAELRPRLLWDRQTDLLTARPGAQRLAVTSGGTIPDRGLFGVFLVGEHRSRVGELDEEMVYESRLGDVFALGSSSWRIEDITHDAVLVSPAPGQPGRLPFWRGDTLGRPAELGAAVGAFVREVAAAAPRAARDRLASAGLDAWAADNLLAYLAEQRAATGHLPDDRTVVVERFRDELGDWQVVVHSPFGAQVHAPWALLISASLRERFGVEAVVSHGDDGIVARLPDADGDEAVEAFAGLLCIDPDTVEATLRAQVGASPLFAARFRECAARALLLPRRDPGRRAPLWQQRQRSAQLLAVAAELPTFPVVLETLREVLTDVYDTPALRGLLADIATGSVRVVDVATPAASPFARSLLFGYVAQFLYEGDTPLAERRSAALRVDPTLLAELLGGTDLRELLDPDALASVAAELQRLTPARAVTSAEQTADVLRELGPLSPREAAARGVDPAWLAALAAARRAMTVRVAGEERWAAVEDAGRLRDGLGTALPVGLAAAFAEPVPDPLGDLVARYARTHVPFRAGDVAAHLGVGVAVVTPVLARLVAAGRLVEGEFTPAGSGTEFCEVSVLARLRRRSLAALRAEAEPVPPTALGRFLPAWQHVGAPLSGTDGLLSVVEQLAGAAVPASDLERWVLPARVAGYHPGMLDELTAAGEVVWAGHSGLPGGDGVVSLHPAATAALTLPEPADLPPDPLAPLVLQALAGGGAVFFRSLVAALPDGDGDGGASEADVLRVLWDLVWSGRVTNDTLAPLRAAVGPVAARRAPRGRGCRGSGGAGGEQPPQAG